MAVENYKEFVDRLIQRYEGGYGWDSGDPGGPTKYGITCYDLAEHRRQTMHSMGAWAPIVRAMSLPEAEQIYQTKYATKDRFNELKSGADCVMLDYGVNSGTVRPIHVAQTIYHRPVNNMFDDGLLKAINDSNIINFVNLMCNERMRFLQALRIWPKFHSGWTARVADLRQYCIRLASRVPAGAQAFTSDVWEPAPHAAAFGDDITLAPKGHAMEHPESLSQHSMILRPVTLLDEELEQFHGS